MISKISKIMLFVMLSTILFLGGCAQVSDTAALKIFDESGKIVAELTGAAIQRDYLYTQQHIKRDEVYRKSYAKSGSIMEYGNVTLADGSSAYLPTKVTFRDMPHFQQNLETRPPDHRGWQTADKIVDGLTTFGLGFLVADFGKSALSGASTQYHGDYNYNPQTAEPYIVNPVVVE